MSDLEKRPLKVRHPAMILPKTFTDAETVPDPTGNGVACRSDRIVAGTTEIASPERLERTGAPSSEPRFVRGALVAIVLSSLLWLGIWNFAASFR